MVTYTKVNIQAGYDKAMALGTWKHARQISPTAWVVRGSTGAVYGVARQPNGDWLCSCPARGFCHHLAGANIRRMMLESVKRQAEREVAAVAAPASRIDRAGAVLAPSTDGSLRRPMWTDEDEYPAFGGLGA